MAAGTPRAVLQRWVATWEPLAARAIERYVAALPEAGDLAGRAQAATRQWREGLGL